ncbi:hypothetical protein AYI69_g11543 [Smittium culicis]|uniref:Uncharacterized protein n=1 Tax=Smittium culicis TaxID=133412 RepID=A0A1R1WXV4_9FUNG|nr:hypothetical protein AYI69_g11543 [Smittium culicis]
MKSSSSKQKPSATVGGHHPSSLMSNQIEELLASKIKTEPIDMGVKLKPNHNSNRKKLENSTKQAELAVAEGERMGEPVELDLPVGQLYFGFKVKVSESKDSSDSVPLFTGEGKSLKPKKKRK